MPPAGKPIHPKMNTWFLHPVFQVKPVAPAKLANNSIHHPSPQRVTPTLPSNATRSSKRSVRRSANPPLRPSPQRRTCCFQPARCDPPRTSRGTSMSRSFSGSNTVVCYWWFIFRLWWATSDLVYATPLIQALPQAQGIEVVAKLKAPLRILKGETSKAK